jgi:DNA invertase Pin-like site-specific DNA recombinase
VKSAREYLRVSHDRSGQEKSNDEQHDDNLAAAAAFGVESFGMPYRDTGSASRHTTKRRSRFADLLTDLESGDFGADVLVLWESSRGSRKVSEWCQLIELCESAGVMIGVTTHKRLYDPTNERDRRTLQEDAVDSEYESGKTAVRVRRAAAANAAAGMPHGRIPYGYRRVYDPVTRKLDRQEPHPDEAPVVVELFDRVAAGHSLTAIRKDFAARGITSHKGVPFSITTLRSLLMAPRYAGRRVHSPNGSPNRTAGAYNGNPELTFDAKWPSLVSDATFFAVRARLMDPARVTTRPGAARHLLSMIARCNDCGGPLGARYRTGIRRYQCRDAGCVQVYADPLDDFAEDKVLRLLTAPDVLERLMPQAVDDAALAAARDEVARVKAEHTDLIAHVAGGKISATLAAGSEPGILARLALAESKVQELVTPAGLRQLIDPGPMVVEHWKALPMEAKREVVKLLFAPGLLGVLSVSSAGGKRPPLLSRVRVGGKPLPTAKHAVAGGLSLL